MIKKITLSAFLFATMFASTVKAQYNTKPFYLGIGIDGAAPLGDMNYYYSRGVGGTIKAERRIFKRGLITLTSGYMQFGGRIIHNGKVAATGYIPVKAGFKLDFRQVYLEPQAGAGYFTEDDKPRPSYSFVLGVPIDKIDISFRYEKIIFPDGGFHFVAARLGIRL